MQALLNKAFKEASEEVPQHLEVNMVDDCFLEAPNAAFASMSGYLSMPYLGAMLGRVGITKTVRFVNRNPTLSMINSLADKFNREPTVVSLKCPSIFAAVVATAFGPSGAIEGVYDPALDVVLDFRPSAYLRGHAHRHLHSSLDNYNGTTECEAVHVHVSTRARETSFEMEPACVDHMAKRGTPVEAVFFIRGETEPDEWSYMDFRRDLSKHLSAIRIYTNAKTISLSIDSCPLVGFMVGEELPASLDVVFFHHSTPLTL